MRYLILICFTLLALNAYAADAKASPVESRLRDYYSAIAKKKIDLAASCFHSESAKTERAKTEISEMSEQFDISYKISEVKEIGRDEDDIVISFIEETTFSKVGGKKLNTFKAKVLMVWRKDKSGAYKIWDSLALNPAKVENAEKPKD